jgi:predicted dehydrogenase
MKVGIIGAGNWGVNLVRNFYHLLGDKGVIVCDTDKNKIRKIKSNYPGLKTLYDTEKLLSDKNIDAVIVATPADKHYEISKSALSKGKHVFVEKPIALDIAHAEELVSIAEEKSLILMVDHLLEYHPAVNKIKELINSGKLGKIYYLYCQRLNLGVVRSKENALWSLGTHDVSVFLYLLEEFPVEIKASGGIYIQEDKKIEDTVFLHLHFDSGIDAHAHLSWLDPHKTRRMTIVGSEKMVIFDDMEPRNKISIFDKGVDWSLEGGVSVRYGDIYLPNIPLYEPLRKVCEHFLDCINNKKRPLSDGNDGLRVLKVLKKAQESLARRV